MDPTRFDAFVLSFARSSSRRRLLGALAGAFAPLTTAAKPNHQRRDRDRNHGRGHDRAAAAGTPDESAPAAARPEPAKCLTVGKRCSLPSSEAARHGHRQGHDTGGNGKHHPPSCAKCCSRFGAAGPDGKPRCACKADGETCANPSQCCGGLCRDGACTKCPGDLSACDGDCVDLQTNAQHCGDCATACDSGQRCVGGKCMCDATSCPLGCCADGSCQRGTSDQACGVGGADCQICGTCTTCDGTQCANAVACCGDTTVCQDGTCVDCGAGQRCQGGQCVCDATSCQGCCNGGQCVPFAQQGNDRCGTDGAACRACTGHDTCSGSGTLGVCGCTPRTTCPNGQTCGTAEDACGGTIPCTGCAGCCNGDTCVAGPDQSTAACGADGQPCMACPPGKPTCVAGVCSCPSGVVCEGRCCPNPTDVCDANKQVCCTPTRTSCPANACGTFDDGCGNPIACPACAICHHCDAASSTCVPGDDNTDCGSGYVCCGGACVDLDFDNSNCGACGQVCTSPGLGSVRCRTGVCCQTIIGFPRSCSASLPPCCAPTQCVDGICCIPTDGVSFCGNDYACCSGHCNTQTNRCEA